MSTANPTRWDPTLYQHGHAFVFERAADLVDALAPRRGERILDVGCGTGQLAGEIARRGATVVGIDRSAEMIEQARRNFPAVRFDVADATRFVADEPFDAVFSNAALHWVKPPEEAAARLFAALKPGGRFVAEFGGKGNVARVLAGASAAGRAVGVERDDLLHANYFPSVGEYATLLERTGFDVARAELFDRPTPLEDAPGAARDWLRMFRGAFVEGIDAGRREDFFTEFENQARGDLFRDGRWRFDYRRLRILAIRPM